MVLLEDKGRDYRRYRHSSDETAYLATRGLQHVLSSNVSAVGVVGDDLIIRFHNGSLYRYENMASSYESIMRSNSKGRWVWRHLRRAGVPYRKIGTMPLTDDIKVSDDELMALGNRFMTLDDLPQFLALGVGNFKLLDGSTPLNINNVLQLPLVGQTRN